MEFHFHKKLQQQVRVIFKGLSKNEGTIWDSKTLTISTFAKKGNTDWLYFYNIGSNNGNNGVWFNLDSGLISTIGAAWSNVKIETFQNGWYRCSATLSFGAASKLLYIYLIQMQNNSVFSTLDNYAYIWGTQIEENNISSYIPTSGSTVTRNQDLCTNGGSLASINSTEGVLYAEMSGIGTQAALQTIGMFSNNVASRVLFRRIAETNRVQALVYANNIIQFNVNAFLLDGFNKVALKYKENDFALWVNGVEVGSSNSGLVPVASLSKLSFKDEAIGQPFFGKTKAVAVWKEALSDSELQSLTTI